MIKVGILSMQRIINYGSFLQAYGLKCILEEMGCCVEFVDYHPGECLIKDKVSQSGFLRKISKAVEVLKVGAPLKHGLAFIKYKKTFSKNYFKFLGISDKKNYFPVVDLLIIGSDEVFNCVQNNVNVGFSPELFGEGNNAKRLISYAASFGNTTLTKLEQFGKKEQLKDLLNSFQCISVRDENSYMIVSALTNKTIYRHIDPVLAYDYLCKCDKIPEIKDSGYIILYGYTGRFTKDECREIKRYAKLKNLKIYCIGGVQHVCEKYIDCSPFEVISYFNNAEAVITDTFHGIILSIITHKHFVVFIRDRGYGNSEKLTDLINIFSLSDCVITDLKQLRKKIETEICYETIDDILTHERDKTYKYLSSNINRCKDN